MALSKKQNQRLGAILSIMFKEDTPRAAVGQVITDGYAEKRQNDIQLTEKGLDEKNRLCTLAGLNIKYTTEKNKKS